MTRRMVRRSAPLLLLAASACAIPDVRPALTPKTASDLALTGPLVPPVDAEWWRAFGDPQLDRLVADALAGSPTLTAATARVRQAEATLGQRAAEDGPNVTLDANAQVARLSGRYTIPPPFAGTVRAITTAGANLSWNLDLFGRQRAAIAAARASAQAAALDAAAARLMLAGAVVQSYLDMARAEQQSAVARAAIGAREGSLRLVRVRIRNQLASNLDSTAAETLLSQAQQALERGLGQRALAANALAALAGRGGDYAAAIGTTAPRLDALALPQVLPADLLARRADVAAAQARIVAAAAGREVARRAYYPDINLLGLVGLQAIGLGNVFDPAAGTANAGGALHLPIFDHGRLRADLTAATAAQDAAIADYDRIVVTAAREGADAIATIRAGDAEQRRAGEVVRGYAETSRLSGVRLRSGLESRLDLVDTDIRLLDAQLTLASLRIDAALARVQLVLALGGGFASQDMPR